MGKKLEWVQEEASGRLIYRRAYPEKLRPFLPQPKPPRELKVTLQASRRMTPEAFHRYEEAKRRFDRDVREATAARLHQQKEDGGLCDPLTPALIEHLAGAWKEGELALDEDVRWTLRPLERKLEARGLMKADIDADLAEARTFMAQRRILHPASAGISRVRLGLRLRRGAHPRWA